MKLNLKNPIVFFDLETTGTNSQQPVLQVGQGHIERGQDRAVRDHTDLF